MLRFFSFMGSEAERVACTKTIHGLSRSGRFLQDQVDFSPSEIEFNMKLLSGQMFTSGTAHLTVQVNYKNSLI